MNSISMDTDMQVNTLEIYERLKKARATEALSKEIAGVFGEFMEDQIATKKDILTLQHSLKNTELHLKATISQSKSETIIWVAGLLLAQAGLITALQKLL